ncbi:MAG: YceI family protein [Acidobacteria bacterium]|nr:YceI family protein [Acidobacteriota bacterium]
MRSLRAFAIPAVVLMMAAAGAVADTETYKIDPSHSNVGFSIRHFFSKVPGKFKTYEGTITLDPKDLSKTLVEVTIDTASIDTGNGDRDSHLQSPDFFDAAKFPKITFKSTGVTPQGTTRATLKGELTMHGVTKPVTLEGEVLGFSPDPWGNYRAGFEAKTKLNRQDYGVSWNKVVEGGGSVLSDEVEITINIEGVRAAPAPKPATAPATPPKKN